MKGTDNKQIIWEQRRNKKTWIKDIARVKSNQAVDRGEGLNSATIGNLDHVRSSYDRNIELYG